MSLWVLTFPNKRIIIFLHMKKLLTVIVCKRTEGEIDAPYEDLEVLYTDEDFNCADIIKNGIKQANGKYIALCDGASVLNWEALSAVLSGANCDVLEFNGGRCFKAGIVRSANSKGDRTALEINCALGSKSVVHTDITPFKFTYDNYDYSTDSANLLSVLDDFNKQKAKVSKDTYGYARDLLCSNLFDFYLDALLKIHAGESSEKLIAFDEKLKENIVVYLALTQNFKGVNLQKIREKNFKTDFFTYLKLKGMKK